MIRAREKACVLTSGGLDSVVLLGRCLKSFREVHPLYVRAGLKWERAELHWLKRALSRMRTPGLKPLTVLDMPAKALYGAHWSLGAGAVPSASASWDSVYLPGRNLLLLSLAGVHCATRDIGTIAIGTLAGNPFADSKRRFYGAMEGVFRQLFSPIRVLAPLAALEKEEVFALGRGLPLELTFSCIDPRGLKPCGRCTKCFERDEGLRRFNTPTAAGRRSSGPSLAAGVLPGTVSRRKAGSSAS